MRKLILKSKIRLNLLFLIDYTQLKSNQY